MLNGFPIHSTALTRLFDLNRGGRTRTCFPRFPKPVSRLLRPHHGKGLQVPVTLRAFQGYEPRTDLYRPAYIKLKMETVGFAPTTRCVQGSIATMEHTPPYYEKSGLRRTPTSVKTCAGLSRGLQTPPSRLIPRHRSYGLHLTYLYMAAV